MATIFDVARHAAVSTSTVSHVVNGTRKVSAETARRVQEAIAAVGYTPNGIARALAVSTTNSVGIAVSTITNPYFGDIICAIERECTRLGLMVFLSDTHDDPEHELRVVKAQHLRRVDGIILAPSETGDSETLNYIEANKIPCVLVDRLTSSKFDRVGIQNKYAMGMVVGHLADHGHKRIGFISGQPGFATAIERTEGFRAALSERGLAVDEALIRSGDSIDGAAAAAAELLARPDRPSALAVGNNMSMIGVIRAIRSAGLSVPGDIALVGFDDFEWADCFEPRLTLVAQPCTELGRQAASLLVQRIRDPQGPPRHVYLAAELKVRASVGRPR